MKLFGILLLLLFSAFVTFASEDTLQLTHVLYRHGDRTPVEFYKSDKYNLSKYWPEGLGQLTKKGMAMEYRLGGWLRTRYGSFLSEEYREKEVLVRSTDYDRTLMSAASVMSAFYYPANKTIRFNKTVPWLPTPIHSAVSGNDKIINVDAACPRVSEEVEKVNNMSIIIKYYEDHKDLFDALSEKCKDDRHSIRRVGFLLDTLFIEQSHGLKIPDWAHEYYDQMKAVSEFSFVINTYSTELKRLRGGPMLEQFSSHMRKFKSGDKDIKKMYMYSAHDSTIAIVLHSMGVYNGLPPPYAATVLVELHKIDKKYFVKMFYRNDTNIEEDAHPLALPGCDHVCGLEKWNKLLVPVIPDDWDSECYVRDPKKDGILLNIMTGWCILIMATLLFFIVCRKCVLSYIDRRIKNSKTAPPYLPIYADALPYPSYGAV